MTGARGGLDSFRESTTTVRLVAEREVRARLASRAFRIGTVLVAVVLLALVLIPQALSGGPDTYRVGAVGTSASAVRAATTNLGSDTRVHVVDVADVHGAKQRLRHDHLDAAVVRGDRILVKEKPGSSSGLHRVVGALARNLGTAQALNAAGLSTGQRKTLAGAHPLSVHALTGSPEEDEQLPLLIAGLVLLYVTLLTYGILILTGVVNEKSSRVVEVLLATIRPRELLAGKVLGLGTLGLAQVVASAAPAIIVAVFTGVNLPSGSTLTILSLLLWFLLGYAFYSCAYAAVGSLVSRTEDAQAVAQPINMLLILAYGAGFYTAFNPDGALARVAAIVPFTSPIAMPVRAALGHTAAWEVPVAVVVILAATYGLIRLGARIYERSVLEFGTRVPLRRALGLGGARRSAAAPASD